MSYAEFDAIQIGIASPEQWTALETVILECRRGKRNS